MLCKSISSQVFVLIAQIPLGQFVTLLCGQSTIALDNIYLGPERGLSKYYRRKNLEIISLIVFAAMVVTWIALPDPDSESASVVSNQSRSPALASPVYET